MVPMNGVIGQLMRSLKWRVPSRVVPLGPGVFGAEAASQAYFGKSARDLTLPEASLLAGLPQSPARYNPLVNLDAAKARQKAVLARMVDVDLITADEAYRASVAPLTFKIAQPVPIRAFAPTTQNSPKVVPAPTDALAWMAALTTPPPSATPGSGRPPPRARPGPRRAPSPRAARRGRR